MECSGSREGGRQGGAEEANRGGKGVTIMAGELVPGDCGLEPESSECVWGQSYRKCAPPNAWLLSRPAREIPLRLFWLEGASGSLKFRRTTGRAKLPGPACPTRPTDWITHLTRPAPGTVTKGHGVSCPNSSWNGASCFEGSQGPPLLIAGDFLKGIGQFLPGSSPEQTSKKLPGAQTLRQAGKVHGYPPSPTHRGKLISLARVGLGQ